MNDISLQIEKYKDMADKLATEMKECFANSQIAYQNGNKSSAGDYSKRGKNLKEQLQIINDKVKELILINKNEKKERTMVIEKIMEDNKKLIDSSSYEKMQLSELDNELSIVKDKSDQSYQQMKNLATLSQEFYSKGGKKEAKYFSVLKEQEKIKLDYYNELVKVINNVRSNKKEIERYQKKNYYDTSYISNDFNYLNENFESYSEESDLNYEAIKFWNFDNIEKIEDIYFIEERNKSIEHSRLMVNKFKLAKAAYLNNEKELASILSQEGYYHKREKDKSNNLAKNYIFNKNNSAIEVIDLHGLYLNEAMELLKERIELISKLNLENNYDKIDFLVVIHGKGLHSSGYFKGKIKIACENYLNSKLLAYYKDSPNEGCLKVLF